MPRDSKTYAGRTARRKGLAAAAIAALLAVGAAVGGTGAYLTAKSDAYVNTFVSGLPTIGTLDGLVSIGGSKAIDGRSWQEGDVFLFSVEQLENGDWTALCDEPASAEYAVDAQGDPVEGFDEFDLTEAVRAVEMEAGETRSFRAFEVIPDKTDRIPGVSYDPVMHYFDVTVDDADDDGELEIVEVRVAEPAEADESSAAADGASGSGVSDESAGNAPKSSIVVSRDAQTGEWSVALAFVNAYSALGEAQAVIHVEKDLEDTTGQGLAPSGFTFDLYEIDAQGEREIVESKATTAAGLVDFALSYGAQDAGRVFSYELVERDGGSVVAGMSYDATSYRFQVEVADDLDGTLSARVTDADQGAGDAAGGAGIPVGTDRSEEGSPEDEYLATFLNVYDPADAAASVSGVVELVGRDMAEGEFSFVVRPLTEGAPGLDLSRDLNDAAGGFSFGDAEFPKVGTYVYEVTQDVSAQLKGVIYDTAVHRVIITVTDDGNGKLVASVVVWRDGVEVTDGSGVKYVNTYEKPDDGGDGPGGGDPDDPVDPDLPEDGGDGGDDDGGSPIPGGSDQEGDDLKQTGDSALAKALLAAFAALAAAAIAALAALAARRAGRGSHDR